MLGAVAEAAEEADGLVDAGRVAVAAGGTVEPAEGSVVAEELGRLIEGGEPEALASAADDISP